MRRPLAAREHVSQTSDSVRARAARAGDEAERDWIPILARVGLAAKGASFAIVGVLAILLAAGEGGEATSREGALATVARTTFGGVLLVGLAIGFAAYALWRFAQTFLEKGEGESSAKEYAKRAAYFARGLIYGGLTIGTIQILLESHERESQNERARKATAEVLSWPAGTWLVGLIGAAIVGAGLYNGYRGVTRKFRDRWHTGKMSSAALTWGTRAGVIGLLARMIVFGLIGVFLVKAAVEYEPSKAVGIDGALQKLAHQTYGSWLLGVTAAGLIAYALFCFVEARFREV